MKAEYKCRFCLECTGKACKGEMPGMGGPNGSVNFLLNTSGWRALRKEYESTDCALAKLRLAPMTGAVENIGYSDERQFYYDIIRACSKASIALSIGDGTPDSKLEYGIEAVQSLQENVPSAKAAVFIKPYPKEKIIARMEKALGISEIFGIDIDSYNIATMRNLVHLEKKSAAELKELKNFSNKHGKPFCIKGIFTEEDLDLVKEVKPDIAFVSNHGGRVETRTGSVSDFLKDTAKLLKSYSEKLWVDGGIRNKADVKSATILGADEVLLGRPFATALCKGGLQGVITAVQKLK